jgi:hypothetical protein
MRMKGRDNSSESGATLLVTEDIISEIESKLWKRWGIRSCIVKEDWAKLSQILQRYEDHATYWKGFPNKGHLKELDDVRKKANKLAKAITGLLEESYALVLQDQLQDHDLDELMSALRNLSELEARSPVSDEEKKRQGDEFLALCAAQMQADLDRWWHDAGGWCPEVAESKTTPYSYFLNEILRGLSGPHTGASRTAVEERRRAFRKREDQFNRLGKMLG